MLPRILIAFFLFTAGACAQLTWGPNGAGGSGTWDASTLNWSNGTSNVVWNGDAGVFSGSPGTVTISGTVNANQLTFNTAGYVITGGSLLGQTDGSLKIITNADATLNATAMPVSFGSGLGTFVKDGTGTLSVGGALLNFARLQINDGNLDLTPASSVTYQGGTATLANTALASITLGGDLSLGGLNGGGALGGNVRPESTVSAVTLTFNNGSGSYAGSLQDNGTAILSIDTLNRPSQILTGVNTYSGTTRVTDGSLTFAGSGSALQTSSITISRAATLVLDNSVGNVTNRIPDTAPITLSGTLSFLGNGAAPSSETAGSLLLGVSVTSKLIVSPDVTQSSSLTLSSFGQASSTGVGAVIFQGKNLGATPGAGTANIYFTTTPTMIGAGGSAGSNTVSIVPYALGDLSPTGTGSTFVTYGTNGIRPLADAEYANNNFGVAGANVNIDGTTTVSTNSSINSLRLKNGGVVGGERYGDGE